MNEPILIPLWIAVTAALFMLLAGVIIGIYFNPED